VDAFERLQGSRFANTVLLDGDDSGSRFSIGADQRLDPSGWYDSATWRRTGRAPTRLRRPSSRGQPFRAHAASEHRPDVPLRRPHARRRIHCGPRFDERDWNHELTYGFEYAWTRLDEKRNGEQTNLTPARRRRRYSARLFHCATSRPPDVTDAGLLRSARSGMDEGRWSVIPACASTTMTSARVPIRCIARTTPTYPWSAERRLTLPETRPDLQASASLVGFFQYSNGFRAPPPET